MLVILVLVALLLKAATSTAPVAPPVTSGLYVQYSAEVAHHATYWTDLSGSSRHAGISGSIFGTTADGRALLTGDTASSILFGTAGMGSTYTAFHRVKYAGKISYFMALPHLTMTLFHLVFPLCCMSTDLLLHTNELLPSCHFIFEHILH